MLGKTPKFRGENRGDITYNNVQIYQKKEATSNTKLTECYMVRKYWNLEIADPKIWMTSAIVENYLNKLDFWFTHLRIYKLLHQSSLWIARFLHFLLFLLIVIVSKCNNVVRLIPGFLNLWSDCVNSLHFEVTLVRNMKYV